MVDARYGSNRVALTFAQPLPVYPEQRTLSAPVGRSVWCQKQALPRKPGRVIVVAPKGNSAKPGCVVLCVPEVVCARSGTTLLMNVHLNTARQFNLVQRAEMLALADPAKARSISALSHILGVSQRTLRKAFNRTHGLSPCRRLRMLRLAGAKQALLSTHAASVTEIATSFGFAELGRFSVEYRKAFRRMPFGDPSWHLQPLDQCSRCLPCEFGPGGSQG